MKALRAAALLMFLSACSGRQTPLNPAGDQAAQSETMWRIMLVVCGIMYLLVMIFLGWALWRARTRGASVEPPAPHHTPAERSLERGLAGWSALIVAGLAFLSVSSFLVDRSLAKTGPHPLEIKVTANQWWWDVEYPGETPDKTVSTANELHLPLGRPARVTLAANDVIHSFWVPNLSGKEDLIPGRINRLVVTPRTAGRFRGQCAEFCGLEHARMALDVTVEPPAAFETWRLRQLSSAITPSDTMALSGQSLFVGKGCALCHKVSGTDAGGVTGPDLTHVASRPTIAAGTLPNTRGALSAWVADPQGVKPGTSMPRVPLNGAELTAVVAYLETLK